MPSISFIAGICLYLRKDDSKLYWYNCSHFQQGCPQENYKASTIYERKFELNYKASGSGSVFFKIQFESTYFKLVLHVLRLTKKLTQRKKQCVIIFKIVLSLQTFQNYRSP